MNHSELEKKTDENKEHLGKGIFFAVLSFFFIASVSVIAKASAYHATTTMLLFFQNLISLALIFPFVLHKGWHTLKTTRLKTHMVRAITGTGAWYCLFLGLTWIVPANAVLLTYSAPLWMPLFGWALFGRKEKSWIWLSVSLGFIGIALVLHPGKESFQMASFIAVAAAILVAFAFLSVDKLSQTEPVVRILFYYFLLSTLLLFPLLFFHWQAPTPLGWVYLISIGIVMTLSQLFIVLAYRCANAVKLSPFVYSVIIFFALMDWLIWKRAPLLAEVIGMGLVILGGVVTAFFHIRHKTKHDQVSERDQADS